MVAISIDDTTAFSSIIEERLDFVFNNADKLPLIFGDILCDSDLCWQYTEQVFSPTIKLLERYIESKAASEAFRPLNANIIARTLASMIMGLAILYRFQGESGQTKEDLS